MMTGKNKKNESRIIKFHYMKFHSTFVFKKKKEKHFFQTTFLN